ncbi:hypothetical protein IT407_00910 [Candidatus Uhrbacteria bacterium]|nr:hypothetical protein [Candidatus Uhrbacteria bacterium]
MKRFGLFLLILVCFGVVQPANAFEIQPAIIDVETDPGARSQINIKLRNDEAEPVTYYVTVEKFIPYGDHGQQFFLGINDTDGLPEWTYVDAPSVTLRPNESINFPVSLRIPAGAAAGLHTAAVFFSPAPNGADGSGVSSAPRIGALLFVTVKGSITKKVSLQSFQVNKDVFELLPADFSIRLRNEGNGVSVPEGEIRIKNAFGSNVATLAINPEAKRILPDSIRALSVAWDEHPFAFGPYTATLVLEQTDVAETSVRFYVWPWRTMLWIAGGLIALIIGYFVLKRIIIRRATA